MQLVQLRVLVVGARGLGIETAKNLALAGPAAITLHDEAAVVMADLGANFFLRPSHVGARRAGSVIAQLKELNNDVEMRSSRQWLRAPGACVCNAVQLLGDYFLLTWPVCLTLCSDASPCPTSVWLPFPVHLLQLIRC